MPQGAEVIWLPRSFYKENPVNGGGFCPAVGGVPRRAASEKLTDTQQTVTNKKKHRESNLEFLKSWQTLDVEGHTASTSGNKGSEGLLKGLA